MCLYSWKSRKRAKEDIECYKLVYVGTGNKFIHSKYFVHKWKVGELNEADKASPGRIKKSGEIKSGYFHSYMSMYEIKKSESFINPYEAVYKCVIPAGSYYYEGIHSDGKEGYASKKLIITDLMYYKNEWHLET